MKKIIILILVFCGISINAQNIIPAVGGGFSTLAWYAGEGYRTRPSYQTIDLNMSLYLGNQKTKYRRKNLGIWPGIVIQLPIAAHRVDYLKYPLSQNFETFAYMDKITNADLTSWSTPIYGAEIYNITESTEERYLSKMAFGLSFRIHSNNQWYLILEPLAYVYEKEVITTQNFTIQYHNMAPQVYGEPYVEVDKSKNTWTYGVNFGWGIDRYCFIIGLENIGIPTSTVAAQLRYFFEK